MHRPPFAQTTVGAILVAVISGLIVWALTTSTGQSGATSQPSGPAPAEGRSSIAAVQVRPHTGSFASSPLPELPYVETDVIPFEGASYGRNWVANRPFDVFASPASLDVRIGHARAGDRVYDETGETHTIQYGIYRIAQTTRLNALAPGLASAITLESGDQVFQLNYYGEGRARFWAKGMIFEGLQEEVVRSAQLLQPMQREWWIRVRLPDGTGGWVADPHVLGKEAVH